MTRSFQKGGLSLILICAILSHSLVMSTDTNQVKSSFIALEDIVPHGNELGGWRTVQGDSFYFATSEPAANNAYFAAIHKVSTNDDFDDVAVQTISLKEIMGNQSGTVEAMTSTFVTLGEETIAAATLSSSQLILFTEALEVLAVIDISSGSEGGADYPPSFSQLIFFATPNQKANTQMLGMFGTNSYVSVEIGISGNVANAATTTSKFTFTDWNSFDFSLLNKKVTQIRDVTVNENQITFAGFAAEDEHWKLFVMPTVPGSTDSLYSKTEDTLDNQIVDVTVAPILKQTSNVIYAGYDRFSGKDTTIEVVNNAKGESRTRTLNLPRDHVTGSRMSIQTFETNNGLRAALMTRDSVLLFEPNDDTHNPWTQTVAANTCSDFVLQHLFVFESNLWALGLVESPNSTVIDKPSIPQLMRIFFFPGSSAVYSADTNLFYTQYVNSRFEDRTFDEIDWDKTASFITKGQYFKFSSPTEPTTPTVTTNQTTNTATAATTVEPLPLLNNSELSGNGYSVSTQLSGTVKGTLVGLTGVELSAGKALVGKVTKPSEGILYGVPSTGNELLSCFTCPVAVEPTGQKADELVALLTTAGTSSNNDPSTSFSATKAAPLGGFFVAVEGFDSDYVNVTRVLASGETAWQQKIYSQASWSSALMIEPIRTGYSQYALSPLGTGLILVENDTVSWYLVDSTDVDKQRPISIITAQDDLIYTFNDSNLVTFSMEGSQEKVVTFAIADVTGLTIVDAASNSDNLFVLFNTPTGDTIYLLSVADPNNPTFAGDGQDISEITYDVSKPTILATSGETVLIGGYVNAGYGLMVFDSKTNTITSTTTVPTTSSVVSVSAVSTTEALVALDDSVILVTLGETPTAKVMTISLSSLTCSVKDTMPTGLVYTIQLSCTPSTSKQTQWAFVTMSTTGTFESKSGNTITVSESKKTVMPTKVTTGVSAKTGTMTFGSSVNITYEYLGNIASSQDFDSSINLSDNFAPYDVPTNGGSYTDQVEGDGVVTKTIERSDFGKNLPTDCTYVSDLPNGIDGQTTGDNYTISYDPVDNTSSDGTTLSGKVEYRCAGWFIGDYDVTLEIEEGAGKVHHPDSSESLFLAVPALFFIFAFMFQFAF